MALVGSQRKNITIPCVYGVTEQHDATEHTTRMPWPSIALLDFLLFGQIQHRLHMAMSLQIGQNRQMKSDYTFTR